MVNVVFAWLCLVGAELPVLSPVSYSTVAVGRSITITSKYAAWICYTTDGSQPVCSSICDLLVLCCVSSMCCVSFYVGMRRFLSRIRSHRFRGAHLSDSACLSAASSRPERAAKCIVANHDSASCRSVVCASYARLVEREKAYVRK